MVVSSSRKKKNQQSLVYVVNYHFSWHPVTDARSAATTEFSWLIFAISKTFPMRYGMTLYLNQGVSNIGQVKVERSTFVSLSIFNFDMPYLWYPLSYSHTVTHCEGLRYGKDESRELSCGCTSSICQDVMKSDNLLHTQGFCWFSFANHCNIA